jgi:hypothetical protein
VFLSPKSSENFAGPLSDKNSKTFGILPPSGRARRYAATRSMCRRNSISSASNEFRATRYSGLSFGKWTVFVATNRSGETRVCGFGMAPPQLGFDAFTAGSFGHSSLAVGTFCHPFASRRKWADYTTGTRRMCRRLPSLWLDHNSSIALRSTNVLQSELRGRVGRRLKT